MRNQYYPLDPEKDAAERMQLAALEHAYLIALHNYQKRMLHHTPMLAERQYVMNARFSAQLRLLESCKDVPLLATLPLVEMKMQLLMAHDPQAEVKLHQKYPKLNWLYPMPPNIATS